MIKKILEKVVQRLNALATKLFKEETYPYPPLSRRDDESICSNFFIPTWIG